MFRRWFIRSLILSLVLLCTVGWLWSITHLDSLSFLSDRNELFSVASQSGAVRFEWFHPHQELSRRGFTFWHQDADAAHVFPITPHNVLGFAYRWDPGPPPGEIWFGSYTRFLEVPYWFLTAPALPLLWFAWRMTRPKPAGKAFPVEPNEGTKQA